MKPILFNIDICLQKLLSWKHYDEQSKQTNLAADVSLAIWVILPFLKTNPTWPELSFCKTMVRSNGLKSEYIKNINEWIPPLKTSPVACKEERQLFSQAKTNEKKS